MAKAEGRIFQFDSPEKICTSYLEAITYHGNEQLIKIDTSEFSCVCPFSGLPDFGRLIIEYVPDSLCIELKSFKYYLISFRNIGIYQEEATNRIYSDFKQTIKPKKLKVITIYNTRGGIDTTCTVEF